MYMKNSFSLLAVSLICSATLTAQSASDTIYFKNGEKLGCIVSRVSPTEIEYSYPNETLVNVERKVSVEKIHFKSGRVQSFAEEAVPVNEPEASLPKGHGEFWGIKMGGDVSAFVNELKAKGAEVLEYKDDEVKLESAFMSFESADIYVHFNEKKEVTYVDVQQNHALKGKRAQETKGIISELNEKYTLVKEGAKPWVIALYRWEWTGDNLLITFNRAGGYSRPHLRFCDAEYVGGLPKDD